MYDVLSHYIKEGLVLVHGYPHPDDYGRHRGRIFKAESVEVRTEKTDGQHTLYVKHHHVWYSYPIDAYFFEEYAEMVGSREESVRLGREWTDKLRELKATINPKEFV